MSLDKYEDVYSSFHLFFKMYHHFDFMEMINGSAGLMWLSNVPNVDTDVNKIVINTSITFVHLNNIYIFI
jgi:hypothetical protein